MIFKLKKPTSGDTDTNKMFELLFGEKKSEIFDFTKIVSESEYLYWDKIQYKEPAPDRVSKQSLWKIVKFLREQKASKTVIRSEDGKRFTWSKLDYFEEFDQIWIAWYNGSKLTLLSNVDKFKIITNENKRNICVNEVY